MRFRSFIFSSKNMPRNTLDGMPRPTHAAQLAIALVVLLRILLWYVDPADERHLPGGPGSDLISASFATRDCTRKIVLIGSSHLLYGVLEKRLAYAWNLPEDSVVNVSLDGSTTWDLRRQIELLMASPCAPSLVITDVSWRMFNSNRIPPVSQRFFALASIDDRVRVEDMSLRARVLLDWIVGDQRHRRTITDWGLALTEPRPPRWKADPRLFWTASELRRRRAAREWTVERIAEVYLSSPAFSVRDVENLQSAIRLLHQRCAAVVLLHTPTKAEYRQSLRATEQGAAVRRNLSYTCALPELHRRGPGLGRRER